MRRSCQGDRGQALPWVLLIIMLGFGLLVVAVRLAAVVDDAARARTAADAAALAGAAEGRSSAIDMAEANGAELIQFTWVRGGVEVRVAVGAVEARARAIGTVVWVPD